MTEISAADKLRTLATADRITPGPYLDLLTVLHPGVGRALADWLEREARQEEYTLAEFGHRTASREALAVAHLINGGQQ